MLSEVELQQMCHEMESKFSRLSEELLTNLQLRDVMAGEMEAKNRYTTNEGLRTNPKGNVTKMN